MRGTASVALGPSITTRGTASVPLGPSITMRGTASEPLGPSITMRGTASVPLGPSITMRGTASVPLGPSITTPGTASVPLRYRSGPLLQCAVPTPRLGFTKFQLDRSEELPRKHKDQRKATKRNLNIVVPALLQTGRSTLAPRHSKCFAARVIWVVSPRSTSRLVHFAELLVS